MRVLSRAARRWNNGLVLTRRLATGYTPTCCNAKDYEGCLFTVVVIGCSYESNLVPGTEALTSDIVLEGPIDCNTFTERC